LTVIARNSSYRPNGRLRNGSYRLNGRLRNGSYRLNGLPSNVGMKFRRRVAADRSVRLVIGRSTIVRMHSQAMVNDAVVSRMTASG
jgi:hypothetical protein